MNVIGEAKKCNVGLSEVEREFYEERCVILQFDDGKRYLIALYGLKILNKIS